MSQENLLAEIKTFAPESDADRAIKLENLLLKLALAHYPESVTSDKRFQEGVRFASQIVFGGFGGR